MDLIDLTGGLYDMASKHKTESKVLWFLIQYQHDKMLRRGRAEKEDVWQVCYDVVDRYMTMYNRKQK